ncbi:unnamed protein product [Diatraea saccharalis]|uniref:Uncharacterized protein n=1 Tax=Diatraea saccharalis TaxID=40085 RepID=A0A9P0C5N4_9NEOP|nr:unnamed protein product [Diatraea saccharalis]
MPLYSEHISNMYYSGSPSYTGLPYSYGSVSSLGTSYSAPYLNPGGNYSTHSSLGGYTRSALPSRWTSTAGRNYSPILSTISERSTGSPVRINSPRRVPISKRTYGTAAGYIPRPININTADIDVSRDRYRHKHEHVPVVSPKASPKKDNENDNKDNGPFMPRVDGKPETGIDSSPGLQRSTIKRGRTVVRLHTIKRRERDSPRNTSEEVEQEKTNDKTPQANETDKRGEEPSESIGWREKLSEDLIYKGKKEKKSLGTKLVEKFKIRDGNEDEMTKDSSRILESATSISATPSCAINNLSKSPDRRCSMELLAEQASLLDSLIQRENLSTTSLDLSKFGVNEDIKEKIENLQSLKRRKSDNFDNPLQTTKSDHSLHDSLKYSKDSRQLTKRRSLKKSLSGGSICRLDSITEFPRETISGSDLPSIEERRPSIKNENKSKPKQKTKTKITSSVEVTAPKSPLKFKVENITVEEKLHTPKKEITYSTIISDPISENKIEETNDAKVLQRNDVNRISVKKKHKSISLPNEIPSPEPEDGNFWDKIGKRETVYLLKRRQNIEDNKEKQKKALFWFPEEEEFNPVDEYESKDEGNMNRNMVEFEEKFDENQQAIKTNSSTSSSDNDQDIGVVKTETMKSLDDNSIQITDNITAEEKNINDPLKKKMQLTEMKQTTGELTTSPIISDEFSKPSLLEDEKKMVKFSEDLNQEQDMEFKESNTNTLTQIESNLKEDLLKLDGVAPNENSQKLIFLSNTIKPDSQEDTENIEKNENQNLPNEVVEDEKHKKMLLANDQIQNKEIIHNDKLRIENSELEKLIQDKSVDKPEVKNPENPNIELKFSPESSKKVSLIRKESFEKSNSLTVNKESQPHDKKNLKVANVKSQKLLEATKKEPKNSSLPKSSSSVDKSLLKTNQFSKTESLTNDESKSTVTEISNTKKSLSIKLENKILTKEAEKTINSLPEIGNETCIDKLEISKTTNADTEPVLNIEIIPEPHIGDTVNLGEDKKAEEIPVIEIQEEQADSSPVGVVKLPSTPSPRRPVKDEPALRPLIATPRPLQKKVPQVIHSSSSSESSSEEESSDEEDADESDASEGSTEFFECENNTDGRTSTGSNDSGFDSSAPTSPAGFVHIKKEQSTAYGLFRKTGRFTPPARSIPRFRKYNIEDFHFIKVLGKGSFGKVLLAELRDTEYYYAVKCLKKDVVLEDDDVECTLIERKVLALGTNHPYLCHLFATFQTDSHLFFVMEYLNGGDLMFHIQQSGRFPEARARFYAAEIVSGLKFLHKRGIVYRDLKLDNILLDFEGHVRIADFGMCKLQIYLEKTADTFCGTPDYMAPEIIKGLKYNQTVDWWSFGVLLYEMLIGQSPFSGCDEDELFWSICNEMPSYPRFLSQEALTILTRLLDKDARTRLGGTECMHGDVRDQEFFHPIHWDRLERRELDAPFKPRVRHPLDTQYFDKAFTGERPRLTAVEPQVLRSMDQEPFRGFSYTNPNATDR